MKPFYLALALTPALVTSSTPRESIDNSLLLASLWVQHSVEYEAVCEGLYATARLQLDRLLKDKGHSAAPEQTRDSALAQAERPAIILDLDETVLDNSPYTGWQVQFDKGFSEASWNEWCRKSEADLVPGAKDFLDYAHSKGVTIFYVTNRSKAVAETREDLEGYTRSNLEKHGLPLKSLATGREGDDVLLLRGELEVEAGSYEGWTSKKGARRLRIAEHYRILMLVGDNFGDFVDGYKGGYQRGDTRLMAQRAGEVAEKRAAISTANRTRWGRDWIMLPNPTYGSWLGALNAYDRGVKGDALLDLRRGALRSFK